MVNAATIELVVEEAKRRTVASLAKSAEDIGVDESADAFYQGMAMAYREFAKYLDGLLAH